MEKIKAFFFFNLAELGFHRFERNGPFSKRRLDTWPTGVNHEENVTLKPLRKSSWFKRWKHNPEVTCGGFGLSAAPTYTQLFFNVRAEISDSHHLQSEITSAQAPSRLITFMTVSFIMDLIKTRIFGGLILPLSFIRINCELSLTNLWHQLQPSNLTFLVQSNNKN